MKGKMGDKARLQHILEAVKEIQIYTSGVSYEEFSKDNMMIYACIKQLEIVGEASNHLSESLKNQYSGTSWKEIVGLRHIWYISTMR